MAKKSRGSKDQIDMTPTERMDVMRQTQRQKAVEKGGKEAKNALLHSDRALGDEWEVRRKGAKPAYGPGYKCGGKVKKYKDGGAVCKRGKGCEKKGTH